MAHVLLTSVGLQQSLVHYRELVLRLQTLGRKSGKKFLCLYLKECMRIMIHFVNRSQYIRNQSGVIVRLSRSGLPMIIPFAIRKILSGNLEGMTAVGLLHLRCTLTILSFYRVLQFRQLPDLSSITEEFSGTFKVLGSEEVALVVSWFPRVRLGSIVWGVSESVGPNGPRATWFSGADAIALMLNPVTGWAWLRVGIHIRNWILVGWFLIISLLVLPVLPILVLAKVNLPRSLGRLSTIKEPAGKRRIVAITDWWTQAVLKPLHIAISHALRKIPQDGTHDQWKPVLEFVLPRLRLGEKAYSFDLSSATDRLPVDLQKQILDLFFPGFGKKWGDLLDRDWLFQRKAIRYAVGQPIGAYSSWVMLALSHHVIVQLAAARAGWTSWFPHYALLGDDIVIADTSVATHYLSIMRGLGVKINLQKSVISETGLIEFAKRWLSGHHGEISAFPPGLLLGVWRNRFMLPMLVLHLVNHNWLHFPKQLIDAISSLRSILRIRPKLMNLMLVTLLGPSGLLNWNQSHLTEFADKWFAMVSGGLWGNPVSFVIRAAMLLVTEYGSEAKARAHDEIEFFVLNWIKIPILAGAYPSVTGILSIPLILVSPGIYIYALSMFKAVNEGLSASLNLAGIVGKALPSPDSIKFELLGIKSLASIDWKRKVNVKEQYRAMSDLMRAISWEVQADLQGLGPLVAVEDQASTSRTADEHCSSPEKANVDNTGGEK